MAGGAVVVDAWAVVVLDANGWSAARSCLGALVSSAAARGGDDPHDDETNDERDDTAQRSGGSISKLPITVTTLR